MAQAHTIAPVTHAAPSTASEEPFLQRQEAVLPQASSAWPEAGPSLAEPEISDTESISPGNANAPPKARYRRPVLAAVLILLTILAAQVGVDAYRGLADTQPALALRLQTLCPADRCAMRQTSALGIDDSSLTASGTNTFHLKGQVSNRSALTLKAPSLSLTLTDAGDEVLARKIYAPKEWAASTEVLRGTSTAPIDLWIQWDDRTSTARVTGYRLQVFYP